MKSGKIKMQSKNISRKNAKSVLPELKRGVVNKDSYTVSIQEAAKYYINCGFQIVPLAPLNPTCNGKVPGKKKWPKVIFKPKELIPGGGVGIKTGVELSNGKYFYAVDIDCGENSEFHYNMLIKTFNIQNPVYQKTVSGGYHIFILLDRPMRERVKRTNDGQIELKGKGRYIAASPTRAKNKQNQPGTYRLEGNLEQIPFVDYEVINGVFPDENIAAELVDELIMLDDKDIMKASLSGSRSPTGKEYTCRLLNENNNLLIQHNTTEILDVFGIEYEDSDEYVKLLCPFHEENIPSFVIYKPNGYCIDYHPDGKIYSLLDFLAEIRPDYKEIIESAFSFNIETYTPRFSKPSLGEVFQLPSCEYEFTRYITEHMDLLKILVTDDEHYDIISDTGSGKTENIIYAAREAGAPLILLLPLLSTVEQKALKYDIPCITGKNTISDFLLMAADYNIFLGTYNSITKLIGSGLNLKQYTLVLDEAHCFNTQNGYRNKVFQNVTESLSAFKKVIRMTGTAEGIFKMNSSCKCIRFNRKDRQNLIGNYTIIAYKNKLLSKLLHHLTHNLSEGRTVILYNNISKLEEIQSYLTTSLKVPVDEVALIHASKQEDVDLVSIKHDEEIRPETRFLLCTTVLGEGANILNEDIGTVYLVDIQDVITIRQFVARFRKGVKFVYDFIPGKCSDRADYPDVELMVRQNIQKAEQVVETRNRALNINSIDVLPKIGIDEPADHYYSKWQKKFLVDENFIRYEALIELNKLLFANPENRKEYLTEYLCSGIQIEFLDTCETHSYAGVHLTHKDLIHSVLSLLRDEPEQLLYTFELKIKNGMESALQKKYKPGKGFDANKYYYYHNNLFSNKKTRDLIERYLIALEIHGFPSQFAYSICQLDKRSYNIVVYKVYTLIYFDLAIKFPSIQNRHIPGLRRDIFEIIQETQHYVHNHYYTNIDINELRDHLYATLSGNELVRKNKLKIIRSFFFMMYKFRRYCRKVSSGDGKQKTEKNIYRVERPLKYEDLLNDFSEKYNDIQWDRNDIVESLKKMSKCYQQEVKVEIITYENKVS